MIPYIEYLDVITCFDVVVKNEQMGEGMILIHNEHMDIWKTTNDELYELANSNTPMLYPPMFNSMNHILDEFLEEMEVEDEFYEEIDKEQSLPMYVLTNIKRTCGANTIIYPQLMEKISKELNGNFYILTSSIHEVILLFDDNNVDSTQLHSMIKEINVTQLNEEEILSDYPYYYDNTSKKVSKINVL